MTNATQIANHIDKVLSFVNALRAVELTTLGKFLGDGKGFERITVAPTVIVRSDGQIVLSGEEGDGAIYGDEIDPAIEAVAAEHGYEFEFESAGAAIAYPIN